MSFLAPALLAALAAIALPIVVHLVQRDRRRVVEFPSLMFLRKIPNQSVKRRAIRHWPLLLLRIAAFALLALAFARPFWLAPARPPRQEPAGRSSSCSTRRTAWRTAGCGPGRRKRRAGRSVSWGQATAARWRCSPRTSRSAFARYRSVRTGGGDRSRHAGRRATRYGPHCGRPQACSNRRRCRAGDRADSDFQKSGWTGSRRRSCRPA